MNITLRPDIQERVNERIQNGEYENADALVQHALDWFLDIDDEEEIEEATNAIDESRAHSGCGELVSAKEVFEGMRAPASAQGQGGEQGLTPVAARAAESEALTVASRIASMADREVRQRYHELVDKRLVSALTVLERFELERIEARLDAEDRDPQIEARDRQWETERTDLLQSIEDLLRNLRK